MRETLGGLGRNEYFCSANQSLTNRTLTQKTLDYEILQIALADVYEAMGYRGVLPDEATQRETLAIINKVRAQGIRAEIYPDSAKMKKQMSYANAKQIPYVVLAGDNEMAAGKVTLKQMETGEQQMVSVEELINLIK